MRSVVVTIPAGSPSSITGQVVDVARQHLHQDLEGEGVGGGDDGVAWS
ncbi:MAG: hypothetical protein V9G15_01080 [Dermatophilaceae bacterium]